MGTVKVLQYNYTHPKLGMPAGSKRMATRERIELMGGWPVEATEIEVDESRVVNGQTEEGFVWLGERNGHGFRARDFIAPRNDEEAV